VRLARGLTGRHYLVATLDRAARRRVTIISAPISSGKDVLLHPWADRLGQDRLITITGIR
jgi:LuxR family transcriptional regulator, maltose regulon positive regulatory protein